MTDTSGANTGDGGASSGPSESTVVHLLRHGEVYNPGGILYGRLPGFHLSEDGRLMAKAATGFLAGRDVVLLRSSPLDWRYLYNPFRPSWGEPYKSIAARMLAAMADAARAARGHEVVCVSHQLPIYTARRAVEGQHLWHDPRRRQCALASVTSFRYLGDTIASVSYAETAGSGPPQTPGACT